MERRLLMGASLAALYMLAAPAHALSTADVEPQTLKEYAVTLNAQRVIFSGSNYGEPRVNTVFSTKTLPRTSLHPWHKYPTLCPPF